MGIFFIYILELIIVVFEFEFEFKIFINQDTQLISQPIAPSPHAASHPHFHVLSIQCVVILSIVGVRSDSVLS